MPLSGRSRAWVAAAAVSLTVFVYAFARYSDSVQSFFFLDDFWLLNAVHGGAAAAAAAFVQLGSAHLYRPVTQEMYFYVLARLFGLDATGYHLVQLFVFSLNCVLVAWIAQALTRSWTRALATALIYAAAPGHVVAVFWIAAFTMIGTTTVIFTAILWWMRAGGRIRIVGATVLQVVGLLCSEHAVVLPLLLFMTSVLGPRRQRTATALWSVAPLAVLVMAYTGLRVWLVETVGLPGPYTPQVAPVTWLINLGRFAAASINLLTLAALTPNSLLAVGAGSLVALLVLVVLVARGATWARNLAFGLGLFVVALIPVLPLTEHYYDYYAGVAGLGAALALTGLGDLIPRHRSQIGAVIAAIVIVTDVIACNRAARASPVLQAVSAGQALSADLLRGLQATRALVGPEREIIVPRAPVTDYALDSGHAGEVFLDDTKITVAGGRTHAIGASPPSAALRQADPRVPPFWWQPGLGWIRTLATRAHAIYQSVLCA